MFYIITTVLGECKIRFFFHLMSIIHFLKGKDIFMFSQNKYVTQMPFTHFFFLLFSHNRHFDLKERDENIDVANNDNDDLYLISETGPPTCNLYPLLVITSSCASLLWHVNSKYCVMPRAMGLQDNTN